MKTTLLRANLMHVEMIEAGHQNMYGLRWGTSGVKDRKVQSRVMLSQATDFRHPASVRGRSEVDCQRAANARQLLGRYYQSTL